MIHSVASDANACCFFTISQSLNNNSLPVFLDELGNVSENFTADIVESPATITAIVNILNNVAVASLEIPINSTLMEVCEFDH